MSSSGSITKLIQRVKSGDAEAVQKLWQRYVRRLVGLARLKLPSPPPALADAEDVVQEAFISFLGGAGAGRFEELQDRKDLWRLLVRITTNKAVDLVRHDGRRCRNPGVPAGAGAPVPDRQPPPDVIALAREQYQNLLACLRDPTLRSVAQWSMEGFTNEEIAQRLGCVCRTVERKLQLIRVLWSKEIES